MTSSLAVKALFSSLAHCSGWDARLMDRKGKDHFVILMYHRILPHYQARQGIQPGMYVDPETFEEHLRFLKEYFQIVPLTLLHKKYAEGSTVERGKPLCVLTFDDGWQDFYQYALPILKRHQIPAVNFLPTDLIGTREGLWTDRLGYLVVLRSLSGPNRPVPQPAPHPAIAMLEWHQKSTEKAMEQAIHALKEMRDEEIEKVLSVLSERWGLNGNPPERQFLSWEEVKEMARTGLVSFGSHTSRHRILTTLDDAEVMEELQRSRTRLIQEGVVDPGFIPFSYPNGSYNAGTLQMVRQAGYQLAVTTERGWNRFGADPLTLKRVAIHQDVTRTPAMLGGRLLGTI